MNDVTGSISQLLQSFAPEDPLRGRVGVVLASIPASVRQDFIDDPRFSIIKLSYDGSRGTKLYIAFPSADGLGSRCVALKPRLAECAEPFGLYVIAHELAHAFLRNGGWETITDPEEAADALAAHWGFPRPPTLRF